MQIKVLFDDLMLARGLPGIQDGHISRLYISTDKIWDFFKFFGFLGQIVVKAMQMMNQQYKLSG